MQVRFMRIRTGAFEYFAVTQSLVEGLLSRFRQVPLSRTWDEKKEGTHCCAPSHLARCCCYTLTSSFFHPQLRPPTYPILERWDHNHHSRNSAPAAPGCWQ